MIHCYGPNILATSRAIRLTSPSMRGDVDNELSLSLSRSIAVGMVLKKLRSALQNSTGITIPALTLVVSDYHNLVLCCCCPALEYWVFHSTWNIHLTTQPIPKLKWAPLWHFPPPQALCIHSTLTVNFVQLIKYRISLISILLFGIPLYTLIPTTLYWFFE